MDWNLLAQFVGAAAAVVIPSVGLGIAVLGIWMENRMYKANEVLLTKINGTYVRTALFNATMKPIQEDIVEIKADIGSIWKKLDAD